VDELSEMRRDYGGAALREDDLAGTWLEQFSEWLADAVASGESDPNAMVFATADALGRPSARTVLLKEVDAGGFILFTNLGSQKGREALANPWGSLVFPWLRLQRQVVVAGSVEPVDAAYADEYFASRPHGSKLGALASPQSEVIADRSVLDSARAALDERYPPGTDVPRPPNWGGLRVVPETVEFWQGRRDRLHDRLRYRRRGGGGDDWIVERLAP
jgi:pyridoxamine 5'-phosphate oxidase